MLIQSVSGFGVATSEQNNPARWSAPPRRTGSARRQHHGSGSEGPHRVARAVQRVHANAALRAQPELLAADEINGDVLLEDVDLWVVAGVTLERSGAFPAGTRPLVGNRGTKGMEVTHD